MFLVCDRFRSERAKALRETILRAGYPCACALISDIREYLPLLRIITYTENLDDVRRTPYDNIRVLAIGEGFVNSALNAEQVLNEEEVLPRIEEIINETYHASREWHWGKISGRYYDDGVFMSKKFFRIYENIIEPTEREYMIFKYLQMTANQCSYLPPERICRFCYPASKLPKNELEAAKNLAVHVNSLNRKCQNSMRCYLIESKRFIGYRLSKSL